MAKKLAIVNIASAIKIGIHGAIAPICIYYYIVHIAEPFAALASALVSLSLSEMGYTYLKPESRKKFINVAIITISVLSTTTFLLSIAVKIGGFYVLG